MVYEHRLCRPRPTAPASGRGSSMPKRSHQYFDTHRDVRRASERRLKNGLPRALTKPERTGFANRRARALMPARGPRDAGNSEPQTSPHLSSRRTEWNIAVLLRAADAEERVEGQAFVRAPERPACEAVWAETESLLVRSANALGATTVAWPTWKPQIENWSSASPFRCKP
jgi:hypothetical protein